MTGGLTVFGQPIPGAQATDAEVAAAVAAEAAIARAAEALALPRHHMVTHHHAPVAATNWSFHGLDTAYQLGGQFVSSGAQNASVAWDFPLSAGTWTLTLVHARSTDRGIYSVRIDDVEVGTIDGYNGSLAHTRSDLTGLVIATTGLKRVSLVMATKNASNVTANYYGSFCGLMLTRTA